MKIKFRFEKGILEVIIPGVAATQEPGRIQLEGGKGRPPSRARPNE